MRCPQCKSKNDIIKYGFYNGVQRYKCKKCNFIFKDKNYAIKTKKEKEFVQALCNLLSIEPDAFSYNYKDLNISPLIDKNNLKNIPDDLAIKFKKSSWESGKRISCRNPKAILCFCGKELRIVFLKSSEEFEVDKGRFKFCIEHKPDEIITKNHKRYLKKY